MSSESELLVSASTPNQDARLKGNPIGQAIYRSIAFNDEAALRFVQRCCAWRAKDIPPFENASDKWSAINEYLWMAIQRRLAQSASINPHPRPIAQRMFELAETGSLDTIPYEIRMRLIDDARKMSAQKRGGNGKHIGRHESLDLNGAVERPDCSMNDSSDGRADDSCTAIDDEGGVADVDSEDYTSLATDESEITKVENDYRARQLMNDPRVAELGPAGGLYRVLLQDPDAWEYAQAELALKLGVTERTIRTYKTRISRTDFVKQLVASHRRVRARESALDLN